MKIKIFLSESGWGPIVRQSSIVNELNKEFPNLDVTVQTSKNPSLISKFFDNCKIIRSDNLIKYFYNRKGDIEINKNKKYYKNYSKISKEWISEYLKDNRYDFFISDMSPEAGYIGEKLKIPTFGICHFTWDWFFSQLFPNVVPFKILDSWQNYQKSMKKFFFPPLTPYGCIRKYTNNESVNFILNEKIKNKNSFVIPKNSKSKFKILLIDSGDQVTTDVLRKILKKGANLKNSLIFHQKKLGKINNSVRLDENTFIGPLIKYVDLVIGRPGYNTITEVLKNKKPAIFLSNKLNPEMDWNISQLYQNSLSGYISPFYLEKNFQEIVKYTKIYKSKEYSRNILKEKYLFNGQKQIAKSIKRILK